MEENNMIKKDWINPNESDLIGQTRLPEVDKSTEFLLQKDLKKQEPTFRELEIRSKWKEHWWDDCIDNDHLFMAFTTFGPSKEKYHVFSPFIGIKRWVSGPTEDYCRKYMEIVVKRKNPYIDFMNYSIKTTSKIIQIPIIKEGSSSVDPINQELGKFLSEHLNDELQSFEQVDVARQRGVAENSKQKKISDVINKLMNDYRDKELENMDFHKKWFEENIHLINKRSKEETYTKKLNTLTFPQVKLYLERESLNSTPLPSTLRFVWRRRILSDGRSLLLRVMQKRKD
jgi:hypothetical protein